MERHGGEAGLSSVDIAGIVAAAQRAPDAPARTAALRMLASLAAALPDETVCHVLEVRS